MRGLRIEPGATGPGDNSLHLGLYGAAGSWDFPAIPGAPDDFHMVRLSVTGVDYKVNVYDLESTELNGDWVLKGTFILGGSGGPDPYACLGAGITLNSFSHSGTSNSKWSADWVRLDVTKALGATDPIIGGAGSQCNKPAADADGDGDVDVEDFAVLQLCYTGNEEGHPPIPDDPAYCRCLDRGDDAAGGVHGRDGDIDERDLAAFVECASGPGVDADPDCPSD